MGRPPESLGSGNVTCRVFLGEVVRNTGSSLSATSPWGNKPTVQSYLPESTKKAPEHELIKGTGYFKLQIPKEISNPLKSAWLTEAPPGVQGAQAAGKHMYMLEVPRQGTRRTEGTQEALRAQVRLPSGLSRHATHQDSLQHLQRPKTLRSFRRGQAFPRNPTPRLMSAQLSEDCFPVCIFSCFPVLNIGERH